MNTIANIYSFAGGESQMIWGMCIAVVLGAILGIERSIAGKHAGMRTYSLVSLGSCLFVQIGILASYELMHFNGINPLQIAGSIVLGIGFIGSGLAVFRGAHPAEITTASGIWVVAGVGMACGFSLYSLATAATLLAVIVFYYLLKIENALRKHFGRKES